jgi:hypothetical protein
VIQRLSIKSEALSSNPSTDKQINKYNHYGNCYGGSSKKKKTKIEFPYDLALPFLSIQSKESKVAYNGVTCTHVYSSTIVTKGKLWNQSRCPSIDEWIKKMWCVGGFTHKMEYYSAIKNEILPSAAKWMELEGITLSK